MKAIERTHFVVWPVGFTGFQLVNMPFALAVEAAVAEHSTISLRITCFKESFESTLVTQLILVSHTLTISVTIFEKLLPAPGIDSGKTEGISHA